VGSESCWICRFYLGYAATPKRLAFVECDRTGPERSIYRSDRVAVRMGAGIGVQLGQPVAHCFWEDVDAGGGPLGKLDECWAAILHNRQCPSPPELSISRPVHGEERKDDRDEGYCVFGEPACDRQEAADSPHPGDERKESPSQFICATSNECTAQHFCRITSLSAMYPMRWRRGKVLRLCCPPRCH
jgi:hypothetical protein